jgi:nucleolar protein 6
MSAITVSNIKTFVDKNFRSSNSQCKPKRLDPVILSYERSPATFEFANDTGKKYSLAAQDGILDDSEQARAIVSLLRLHAHHIEFTERGRIRDTFTSTELLCAIEDLRMFFGNDNFCKRYTTKSKINSVTYADTRTTPVNAPKKRKRDITADSDEESGSDDDDEEEAEDDKAPKKPKSTLLANEKRAAKKARQQKKVRFLLFVGNLPYDYTKEAIRNIFKACDVIDVRIPTEKDTEQPKGFAFVEFSNSQDLNHALGFHKTLIAGRRINIELTVGGGGNSIQRKKKLGKKHQSLALERFQKNNANQQSS